MNKDAIRAARERLEEAWPRVRMICGRVPEAHELSWRHELRYLQDYINTLAELSGTTPDHPYPDHTHLGHRSKPADEHDTARNMPDQRLRLAYRHLARSRKRALELAEAALGEAA